MTTQKTLPDTISALVCAGLLAVGLCAQSRAADTESIIEESAYQLSHIADTLQTIQIGKSNGKYYEAESAWAMGREPTVGSAVTYMGATAIAHGFITYELVEHGAPRWVTRTWEMVTIGWSAEHVYHNNGIGLKVKF